MKKVSTLPLPLTPQAIDTPWLNAALASHFPGVQLASGEVRDIIYGTSTKIRVALAYEKNPHGLPATLMIKGGFEQHSPALAFMYANEMRFYRDIAPHMPLNVPRCFFAASDPASHQSIVILEDLCTRNVSFLNARTPSTYGRAAAFLDAMARYHARWWNHPDLSDNGTLGWVGNPFGAWSKVYIERYLKPDVWAHYMAQPRGASVSVSLHDSQRTTASAWPQRWMHWRGCMKTARPR